MSVKDAPTTPVYDISGQDPVLGDLPHDQVQAAISSGKYSFPKGHEISVVSPDGTMGTVPAEHAPDAFKNGYQYATPDMLSQEQDKETYGTTGQQALAGIEGAAQGVAGPLAPLAERTFGVNPEDIRKRAEQNPWTHGIGETAGFGAGMFTGASEASALGHAGEAVAEGVQHAITGGVAQSAAHQIAGRLAGGAARMATEMGLYQAGDEASKAILQDPNQTMGGAAANVGLSALLGGAVGVPLTGLGMGAKAVMNSQALKDFTDRLAFRGAHLDPTEMMQHELNQGINSFDQIGDEVNGFSGLKARAIQNLLPKSVTPEISEQLQRSATAAQDALAQMTKADVPPRLAKDYQAATNRFLETATNPEASVGDHFDALNQFKNDLQDYSKGRWGINAPQRTAEDYQFLKITKDLAHGLKTGLEDGGTWGDAADVQKSINKAWAESIPAVKDVTKKFMTRVGNEYVVDPQKFTTYMNQNGKATSQTIRQQMMGNFVEAIEGFHKAVADVSERAGIENPVDPVGLTSLRDSIEKPSLGSKLADTWHDKLGAYTIGNALGGGVGGLAGHATGIPEAGFAGAYLGRWALGPIFGAVIKPMMEKGADLGAARGAMGLAKAAIGGNEMLENSALGVFGASAKTLPSNLMPSHSQVEKLDDQLQTAQANPKSLLNVAGDVGKYAPDHAQAWAQTSATAVNYLNSLRPSNPRLSPLDADIPVSRAQRAPFERALAVAEQPLSILEHIKKGTLLPQDMKTLQTIYPGFYQKMSEALMNGLTTHKSEGGEVPYRVRQSLSLFLGQPLDSTFTPQSIQAIQGTYARAGTQSQPGAQAATPKRGTSKLPKISEGLRTPEQARMDRANQG